LFSCGFEFKEVSLPVAGLPSILLDTLSAEKVPWYNGLEKIFFRRSESDFRLKRREHLA